MTEDTWLALLVVFFAIPTVLLSLRVYYDLARYIRSGYHVASVISLIFAILSYLFFLIACAMALWRNQKPLAYMDRVDISGGVGEIPQLPALGRSLQEASMMHSYIIPTGLWLCKGSFAAMYFNLKRHLNQRTKLLLYATVIYLIISYIVLILAHALWCDGKFGKEWSKTTNLHCTPFAHATSISIYVTMNITSDILILAIPIVILHHITVLPREKYGIFFLLVLGLGTIATTAVCCALHIAYLKQIVVYYSYAQLAQLLACIELSIAIAAASLPSLKSVLYRKRETARGRIKNLQGTGSTGLSEGMSKRSHSRSATWPDVTMWEDDVVMSAAREREEDEGPLVIMRRLSYDVESMDAPPDFLPGSSPGQAL